MKVSNPWLGDFVRESNRIEGIRREATDREIEAHQDFFALDSVMVKDMERFVARVQPYATIRERRGMDVRVGDHVPPPGGPRIPHELNMLLVTAMSEHADPHAVHLEYETLHPFMDGNGRSGRVLWAWMMRRRGDGMLGLGFLHAWYYQSLSATRERNNP